MIKKLGILTICTTLSACSYFNLDNNKSDDQYARCKEIKHRMIFNNVSDSTNEQTAPAQQSVEMDNLSRAYKTEDCS